MCVTGRGYNVYVCKANVETLEIKEFTDFVEDEYYVEGEIPIVECPFVYEHGWEQVCFDNFMPNCFYVESLVSPEEARRLVCVEIDKMVGQLSKLKTLCDVEGQYAVRPLR